MALVIKGSSSGQITLDVPAAAGTNTITFPAETGNVLTDGSALPAIDGSALTGLSGGITQADIWRLTTNVTADTGGVTNFERADDNLTGYLGTGMSFSSPDFSFPETGLYLVQCQVMFAPVNDSDNIIWRTNASDGAGTTNAMADCQGSDGNTSSISQCIVDVQTTNYTVSFQVISLASGGNITGNTNDNVTSVLFLRLGDT